MSHSPTSSNTTGTTPSSDSQRSTATSLETSSSRTTPTAVSPDFKHLEDQNNELLRENKQLKVDIASATSRAKTRYKERQDALHANRRLQTALDYEERERKGERKSLDLQLSLHKDIIAKLQQNSQQHASVNDDQLQACRERITQLEAENLAQSSKITDLEKTSSEDKTLVDKIRKTGSAMLLKMKLRLNKTEEHRQRLEAEVTEEKAKVTKLEAEIKNMIEEAKREKPGVSSLTGMQTSNKLNKRLLYPQSDSAQMAVEMNKRRKTHENGGFIHTTPPQHHYSNASASSASDMSSTPSKAAPWPLMQQAQSTMPSSGQTQLNAAPPQMDSRQLMANMGPRRAFKQSIPSVESMTPAHQPPLIRMRTPSFSSLGSNQNAPRFPTQMIHPTQNAMGQMLQRNILHMQQSQQGLTNSRRIYLCLLQDIHL
ncbi:hypothetical protein GQ44DRAFT_290262 [Phaeosphaeriaceae sp. PMI808]|nr:hypothetical protein GQ44DRAFT_290262 [Phaeosphaeriaceae sp. PMI808]